MSRDEMIKELMWLSEGSGTGFGICTVANMFIQNTMRPQEWNEEKHRFDDDWKSVVAIQGPAEQYTDDELMSLVAFHREQCKRYDEMFAYRMGCNLIIIGKARNGHWLRKRQTWDMGPMYSDTLEEALEVFD